MLFIQGKSQLPSFCKPVSSSDMAATNLLWNHYVSLFLPHFPFRVIGWHNYTFVVVRMFIYCFAWSPLSPVFSGHMGSSAHSLLSDGESYNPTFLYLFYLKHWLGWLLLVFVERKCGQTDRQTDRRTDRHPRKTAALIPFQEHESSGVPGVLAKVCDSLGGVGTIWSWPTARGMKSFSFNIPWFWHIRQGWEGSGTPLCNGGGAGGRNVSQLVQRMFTKHGFQVNTYLRKKQMWDYCN